ncbi:hypothetical protein K7G98_36410, partial [Saccharothrix sp. MB29]|nr:hypothetical protein [Saccharothrix sp. MB29]
QLTSAGDGDGAPTVTDVERYTHFEPVYDLTVDGVHTYYVLAGETPILVHNCGSGSAPGVLEVSDQVSSTRAFHRCSPSGRGGVEYVFDPVAERLLVGAPKVNLDLEGNPHQQLARSGGLDESSVLGGAFS